MRVRLKGINRTRVRRGGGETVTYYYAWKGGPRLDGEPGSPEFVQSYEAAHRARSKAPPGTLQAILDAYQRSAEFTGLAPRTRADYITHIKRIERRFGSFPTAGLTDRRTRGVFLAWRDELAVQSRRQADYTFSVFARALAWAHDRAVVAGNPLERIGRLYRSQRADALWREEDEAAFLAVANPQIRLAYLLAAYTGQRQSDLLTLAWSRYDGQRIRIRQSKTGARVSIPVAPVLKTALDQAPRSSPVILTTKQGQPWKPNGFRSMWKKTAEKAQITGLTFHDLRGTAVTRLLALGYTQGQVASITGHTLSEVSALEDYIGRRHLAETAPVVAISRTDSPK